MNVKVTIERPKAPAAADCGAESCGLLLTRLARAANRSLAVGLDELGLRSVQFGVLYQLADAGPAAQADLAAGLRVHASNLVRVLDEMEGEGLISRQRDPRDRRRQVVLLTPAGVTMLNRAERAAALAEAELLAALDATERAQLRSLLGRVAAHACARGCG